MEVEFSLEEVLLDARSVREVGEVGFRCQEGEETELNSSSVMP